MRKRRVWAGWRVAAWPLSAALHFVAATAITIGCSAFDIKLFETVLRTTDHCTSELSFCAVVPDTPKPSESEPNDTDAAWPEQEFRKFLEPEETPTEIAELFCDRETAASFTADDSKPDPLTEFEIRFEPGPLKTPRGVLVASAQSPDGGSPAAGLIGVGGGGYGADGTGNGRGLGTGNGAGDGTGKGSGLVSGAKAGSPVTEGRNGGAGSGVHAPRPKHVVRGEYPSDARRAGIEGKVMLRIEVLASGDVGIVAVDKSAGNAALDNAACQAAKRWSFYPAEMNGRCVASVVHVPYIFRLTDKR